MFLSEEIRHQSWMALDYVVLDLEGTGAQHQEKEGIVDIAGVLVHSGEITIKQFKQRLNPEITIPPFISKIHGICNKDVKNEPIFNEIKVDLLEFLNGHILVAHNAYVEWRVLHLKLPEYKPPIILDTLRLSRSLYPNASQHNLDALIERFNLEGELNNLLPDMSRHAALFDSYATALVFIRILSEQKGKVITFNDVVKLCALHPKEDKPKRQNKKTKQLTLFD